MTVHILDLRVIWKSEKRGQFAAASTFASEDRKLDLSFSKHFISVINEIKRTAALVLVTVCTGSNNGVMGAVLQELR